MGHHWPACASGRAALGAGTEVTVKERSTGGTPGYVLAAMAAGAASLGGTLLAATAAGWWIGDLAVHFRPQYAAVAIVSLLVLVWAGRWAWAGAALAALLINWVAAAPVLEGASVLGPGSAGSIVVESAAAGPAQRRPLRIASINVLFHNTQYDRVATFLRAARPDAAVLVEITPRWRDALAVLHDVYPYQYYAESPVAHGTLLLSRWPLVHVEPIPMGPHADPTIVASLDVHGRTLHLIGVHPSWPIGAAVSAERNRELRELAQLARATPQPLVMAGDFNVTPFSPHFQAFVAASGLKWTGQGAGWEPTWPSLLPVGGIQIDHAFVSPTIAVQRFARGPRTGSDHWPILVDLEW